MNYNKLAIAIDDVKFTVDMLEAINDVNTHYCKDADEAEIRRYLCMMLDANRACFDALDEEDE